MEFAVRTRGTWTPAQLAADPRRTICLLLSSTPAAPPLRSACLHAGRRRALFLALTPLNGGHSRTVVADITRSDRRSFDATVDPAELGLGPTRFAWRVQSTWVDRGSCAPTAPGLPCTQLVPASGAVAASIASVRPVGCTRPRSEFVSQAHTRQRTVALTFDDGPSQYTPQVLSVLERNHVNATFFVIGDQVASRAAYVRRELRDGDVVGDHTWSHANVSGGGALARGQLQSALGAIQRVSGFRTCVFRAPYGAVSGALFSVASQLGLTTIQWNVDPRDWARPGVDAIVSNVLANVRPGYIVIMHDGGGPRSQTVAALPRIIRTLRSRGYTFDTIPELLGQSVLYGR